VNSVFDEVVKFGGLRTIKTYLFERLCVHIFFIIKTDRGINEWIMHGWISKQVITKASKQAAK